MDWHFNVRKLFFIANCLPVGIVALMFHPVTIVLYHLVRRYAISGSQRQMPQYVLVPPLVRPERRVVPVLGKHDSLGHADHPPSIVEGKAEGASEECPVVINAGRSNSWKDRN